MLADSLGIEAIVEDIAPALEGLGCYRAPGRGDPQHRAAVRRGLEMQAGAALDPRSGPAERHAPHRAEPEGRSDAPCACTPAAYLQIVAATNYKQRVRKMTEYYHADRLNYAVAGTPNRLEYDQGFFVKQGDGAADVKPIAHLYKTQVYQLAAHLGIPEEIRRRPPTTDTFSMPQTQEEFYFALPYDRMDLCLYALNHGIAAAEVAPLRRAHARAGRARVQGHRSQAPRAPEYLHTPPLLCAA